MMNVNSRVARSVAYAIAILLLMSGAASAQTPSKSTSDTKYKEARDLIRRARTLLSDYVSENPKSDDAYFARLQLSALENIFRTDAPVVPTALTERVTWRVLSVTNRDSDAKVTLEIENTDDSREASFGDFNNYPLVIVANKKVYSMKRGEVKQPNGTQLDYKSWKLQPTHAVTIDVYFDALDDGVLDGFVKYAATDMREKPARFSLMNANQQPAQN